MLVTFPNTRETCTSNLLWMDHRSTDLCNGACGLCFRTGNVL